MAIRRIDVRKAVKVFAQRTKEILLLLSKIFVIRHVKGINFFSRDFNANSSSLPPDTFRLNPVTVSENGIAKKGNWNCNDMNDWSKNYLAPRARLNGTSLSDRISIQVVSGSLLKRRQGKIS